MAPQTPGEIRSFLGLYITQMVHIPLIPHDHDGYWALWFWHTLRAQGSCIAVWITRVVGSSDRSGLFLYTTDPFDDLLCPFKRVAGTDRVHDKEAFAIPEHPWHNISISQVNRVHDASYRIHWSRKAVYSSARHVMVRVEKTRGGLGSRAHLDRPCPRPLANRVGHQWSIVYGSSLRWLGHMSRRKKPL